MALADDELTGVESIQNSKSEIQNDEGVYDLSGRSIARMQKGIDIMRMSDGTTRKVLMK